MKLRSFATGLAALSVAAPAAFMFAPAAAQPLDAVSFGTNWLAQAEHGGFYQAIADGTYAAYGLDVTIVQGGPGVGNRARFVAGQFDFYMGGQLAQFDMVRQGIPTLGVAAIFQKDPQVILTHPGRAGTFEDLAELDPLYLGAEGQITFFEWMKAAYPAFNDTRIANYSFSPAPFIANENSGQQGYVTSEPHDILTTAGWAPDVFLLADHGFGAYSTTIETHRTLLEQRPDIVARFVEASIIGWVNYLYGDNAAANALIVADNPDMTPERIAYSIQAMKDYGILLSGDALTGGIGCMTDARYQAFHQQMAAVGVVPADLDITQAYTTEFVCAGVGLDRLAELSGTPSAEDAN
jgi:NitT/TauT family transport system substrate-binding protein